VIGRRKAERSARARRLRMWSVSLGVSLFLVVIAWQAAIRLPWRPVTEIAVTGTTYVDQQVVVDSSRIRLGLPIFSIDVDSVIERVESLVWVEKAELSRSLAGRCEIRVRERTPVGLIWDRAFYVVDVKGYTFLVPPDRLPDLPLLTGLESRGGMERRNFIAQQASLLGVLSELSPLRSIVSEICVADPRMTVMVLSPKGTPVWLPAKLTRNRLVMVASLIRLHPEVILDAQYLDARFFGRIAVRS
jgi:hypothetical protein